MSAPIVQQSHFKDRFSLEQIFLDDNCPYSKTNQINAYVILWIKDGSGNCQIDFRDYAFKGSTLIFLSPNQVLKITEEIIRKAYLLSFSQEFYCIQTHDKEISCNGVLFNRAEKVVTVPLEEQHCNYLGNIIEQIFAEMNNPQLGQHDLLQSYLKQFIVYSVRLHKEKDTVEASSLSKLYKDFGILLNIHFKKAHKIQFYAKQLGVAPKSLSKHFQKLGLQPPSILLKERLVLESQRALAYTQESIKYIAFDLGFKDPAYFSRFFKKATGITAQEFRSKYQD